mgnify:CR=1 FL=1
MSILIEITEGWTWELGPFICKSDGVSIDLTGLTTELVLRNASGTPVVFGGTVRIDADQVTNPGYWYFTPDADTFVAGKYPYKMHLKVSDSNDNVVFFPNGQPYEIAVWPA